MKKIKGVLSFYNIIKPGKNKFIFILILIYHILALPAFIFHEFMHILTIFLYGNLYYTSISKFHIFDVKENGNGTSTLQCYNLILRCDCSDSEAVILSISPLIGWFILLVCSVLFLNIPILLYSILYYNVFFPSNLDNYTFKLKGGNEKLANFLDKCIIKKKYNL
jgi:hypothetical protein